jgi:hypothetical protein
MSAWAAGEALWRTATGRHAAACKPRAQGRDEQANGNGDRAGDGNGNENGLGAAAGARRRGGREERRIRGIWLGAAADEADRSSGVSWPVLPRISFFNHSYNPEQQQSQGLLFSCFSFVVFVVNPVKETAILNIVSFLCALVALLSQWWFIFQLCVVWRRTHW